MTAPSNWKFRAGSGTISYKAAMDISAATIAVTSTTITATMTTPGGGGGDNGLDIFTITGVWVQAITGSIITGAVNILRTSGNP